MTQWITGLFLSVVIAGSPFVVSRAKPSPGGCVEGVWDLKTTDANANTPLSATSTHYCLFNGRVEMAEYRSFGPLGQMAFAGVSFHAWQPDGLGLTTLWLMVGDPGFTIIPTQMDELHRLVANGWGQDQQGQFLERSVTTTAASQDYQFIMERSRDNGATWQRQTEIDGVFRSVSVPDHSTTLRAPYMKIRGSAPPATSRIILDGLAELSTHTTDHNGAMVDVIHFSSAYGPPPGHWRTITWQAGATTFQTKGE